MGFFDKKGKGNRRNSRLHPENTAFRSRQKWEAQSKKDKELQTRLTALVEYRDDLQNFNERLKTALDMKPSTTKRIIGKLVNTFLPERFHTMLPEQVMLAGAEERDILDYLGEECRMNVDNVQEAVVDVVKCAKETYHEYKEMEEEISVMEQEGWNAQELLQYLADKAGVQIHKIVMSLLDTQFNLLNDAEKEKRGKEILAQIHDTFAMKKAQIKMLEPVCAASLFTLERAIGGFYNYMNVVKPTIVLKSAAEKLVKTNETLYSARDAIEQTITTSIGAIGAVLDAVEKQQEYSVVSEDMRRVMVESAEGLHTQLKGLQIEDQGVRRKALSHRTSDDEGKKEAMTEEKMPLDGSLFADAEAEEVVPIEINGGDRHGNR